MVCITCGRKLKADKSKELGYGPVCYRKLFGISIQSGGKVGMTSVDTLNRYEVPGQMSMEDFLSQMVLGK